MILRAYLKPPDRSGLSRISIAFNNNGKQWVHTKIKVSPKSWDQEAQYIRAGQPLAKKLNAKLIEKKAEITNAIEALLKDKISPTTATVGEYLRPKEVVSIKGVTVAELLFEYERQNAGRLSKGYLRKYGTIARSLEDWKPNFLADDLTHENAAVYANDHLLDVCECESNTIYDYFRRIIFVLGRAQRKGRVKTTDFLEFNFKYIKPKPFWLNWTDIEVLEKFEPLPELIVYKEEFLFRCYTGLRWSDAAQLRPEHFIKKDGAVFFDFHVVKTNLNQNIQMSAKAVEILKKWGFKVPKLYASDCNEKIKLIFMAAFKKAKDNTLVEKIKFKGSEREINMVPKWKLVTTHVARRSFARRWMDLGGEIGKLSKYLGHSSIGQTSDYVGYATKEVNDELNRLMG